MATSVGQFVAETGEDPGRGRDFSTETSRIPEARIDGTVWARLGAMVACRGDLTFEHAGIRERGIGRTIKEKVTGEEVPLMTVEGAGSAYFAAGGRTITVVSLDADDSITVAGRDSSAQGVHPGATRRTRPDRSGEAACQRRVRRGVSGAPGTTAR